MFKLRIRAFICAHIDMHYNVSTAFYRDNSCALCQIVAVCCGYGADEKRGGMRIHLQGCHSGTWSQNKQGSCNGKQVQHRQDRVFLGQAWVFDRRTVSNRARQRYNPGTRAIAQARCKQSLKNPRYTGRRSGNRDQGNTKWLDLD